MKRLQRGSRDQALYEGIDIHIGGERLKHSSTHVTREI